MAVADIPTELIVNVRSSYDQFLWLLPGSGLYRWDKNIGYMYAYGAVPVEGQGLPPGPPVPNPDAPFSLGELEYLNTVYVKTVNGMGPDVAGNVNPGAPGSGWTVDQFSDAVKVSLNKADTALQPDALAGFVKTINGNGPDAAGNVNVQAGGGGVATVNGERPDVNGDVNISASDVGAAPASHTHTASQISDSTGTGRSLLAAASSAAARAAIGAGRVDAVNGIAPDSSGLLLLPSPAASVQITPKMAADNSYEYEVVRVRLNGAPAHLTVDKMYPGGWAQGATAPGAAQSPTDTYVNTGAYTILSSDAYESGRMTNVQIKGGVILESRWGSADTAGPAGRGLEALGFRRDGTWKLYTQAAGDTAASMVADGVDTTYGFGPAVVRAGAVRDIETDATWTYFASSLSARSIIGRAANGDVIYILVKGKSGASGIKGNTCGQIALAEGCVDAILIDGGGTTQGFTDGRAFHPSTDAGGMRSLRSAVALRVPKQGPIRNAPFTIPYEGGSSALLSYPMQCDKVDGVTRMYGTVGITSAAANTWYTVGTLPERFRPGAATSIRGPLYANQNGYPGVTSIDPATGSIQVKFAVVGATGSVSWLQFDGYTFPAAY